MTPLSRRHFLQLSGAATAGMMLDPERLLWVPGAKTFFLPDKSIVEATTMAEALTHGFVAVFPDGARLEIHLNGANDGLTLDERFANEVTSVMRMGGRIVENRSYVRHEVSSCSGRR